MQKVMKTKNFLILLFLTLLLAGCTETSSLVDNLSNSSQIKTPAAEDLENQYETDLAAILKPFWQNNNFVSIKDKALALKAPAKYVDLHFNLIIAFELIEQGQTSSDQAQIEQGLEKLNVLKTQYPWIDN